MSTESLRERLDRSANASPGGTYKDAIVEGGYTALLSHAPADLRAALDVLEKLGAAYQHDVEVDDDEMDDQAIELWHQVFVAYREFEALP